MLRQVPGSLFAREMQGTAKGWVVEKCYWGGLAQTLSPAANLRAVVLVKRSQGSACDAIADRGTHHRKRIAEGQVLCTIYSSGILLHHGFCDASE